MYKLPCNRYITSEQEVTEVLHIEYMFKIILIYAI